ncbi:MAG: SulP family inorganic anion transporter, partial [Pseudomonadota bacterium]
MAALANRTVFSEIAASVGNTDAGRVRIEILAGLTVALALVPEAVAFAFVAGVHPLVGLYAAFIV